MRIRRQPLLSRFLRRRQIHVATVHFETAAWIDVQLRQLAANLKSPVKIWAYLDDFDDADFAAYQGRFDFCEQSGIEIKDSAGHAAKLNQLASLIARSARDSDILMFLDGDAFPVRPLDGFLHDRLGRHELIAIRRDENGGDRFPHPSFCCTTVGRWMEIGGDWSVAPTETTEGREVSDTGGELLRILDEHDVNWYPLLRTSMNPFHPVYFGIYDDVIYHHGGAFAPRQGTRVLRHRDGTPEFEELRQRGAEIRQAALDDPSFFVDLLGPA